VYELYNICAAETEGQVEEEADFPEETETVNQASPVNTGIDDDDDEGVIEVSSLLD